MEPVIVAVGAVGADVGNVAADVGIWVLRERNKETDHPVSFGKHGSTFHQS